MVAAARVCCLLLALVIVAALLSIESDTKVSYWLMSMFIVIPIALTFVVYLVDSRWSASIDREANNVLDEVLAEAEKKTQEAVAVQSKLPVKPDANDTNAT